MIPWFLPILVTGTVFKFFLSDAGIINSILVFLKLRSSSNIIPWITSGSIAIYSLTIANIWRGIPFTFILLYTGMKGIPNELYEAAEVDGAIGWKRTLYITVPLLKPVIVTTIILATVFNIKIFNLVWIITKGGPGNTSHLLSSYSYKLAFSDFNFGLGAAVCVIMLLVVISVVGVSNLIKAEE